MVDYNVAIPGGGSNALHPLALMALQQRGQLGEGTLAYREQLLALKQQQVDNQLAKAALSQENTAAAKKDQLEKQQQAEGVRMGLDAAKHKAQMAVQMAQRNSQNRQPPKKGDR